MYLSPYEDVLRGECYYSHVVHSKRKKYSLIGHISRRTKEITYWTGNRKDVPQKDLLLFVIACQYPSVRDKQTQCHKSYINQQGVLDNTYHLHQCVKAAPDYLITVSVPLHPLLCSFTLFFHNSWFYTVHLFFFFLFQIARSTLNKLGFVSDYVACHVCVCIIISTAFKNSHNTCSLLWYNYVQKNGI